MSEARERIIARIRSRQGKNAERDAVLRAERLLWGAVGC